MSASKPFFSGDYNSGNSIHTERLAQEIQKSQNFPQKTKEDINKQQELEKEPKNYKRNLNYFNG